MREEDLVVQSARVIPYVGAGDCWEVRFKTNQGTRMSVATWNSRGAVQAYADAVLAGKRKPEFFYG